jgi:hypothetical protein
MASAATITTKGEIWRLFWRCPSPRVMAVGLGLAAVARIAAGSWASGAGIGTIGFTWWDLVAVAIVVAATPFVEWAIHLLILHRRPFTVRGRTIDVAAGHREHHLAPGSVHWILLTGGFAGASQVFNGALAVAVIAPPLWLAGLRTPVELAGPLLTGVVAALVALFHYEWCHLLFHTGYRPRTRYYRRLKQNHRLHHWRNEHHWLGITGNAADRVLGTYPRSKSDVPLSPTARTLGVDPLAPGEPIAPTETPSAI